MAKVLVVDDSKLSRLMHANTIRSLGHDVFEANNGESAFELFQKISPDLVVTDLLMPRMSGAELIQRLRELTPELPVVVISADVQQTSREYCRQLGANAFFNKPLRADDLATYLEGIFCTGGAK